MRVMRQMNFPTGYKEILDRVNAVDPVSYAKTKNFTNGAVTGLSPYISRGVISTKQVMSAVLEKGYTPEQAGKLIQELAWRDYFQRVWQYLGDDMFEDIRLRYTGIRHSAMPAAVQEAQTGIEAVDQAIRQLYESGYMHNHLRMYTAAITCNTGKAHWPLPSQWMYYHLLDGDLASNTCSWQWVAGTFSSKQYYCNQDNINHYTGTMQRRTFLDKSYEELSSMPVPEVLAAVSPVSLTTPLPEKEEITLDTSLPLLLYNGYNLDPAWRAGLKANRVLLLEPSHFRQYPVSKKVIDFILSLAGNIEGIRVFTGEVHELRGLAEFPVILSKEHPAFTHYPGKKDERDWLFPEVNGFFNSFFAFWRKAEAFLPKKTTITPERIRA